MSAPLLQIENLSCERDERALFENLSLTLQRGEILEVRGANGSGKTTLLRALAGLFVDFEGTIRVAGERLTGAPREFVYFGHRTALSGTLGAAGNLRWWMELGGRTCDSQRIHAALGAVGLDGWENVPCAQMSAGQQRRVALARLPLSDAPLWLLDEPLTALDDAGMRLVTRLLADHARAGGAAVCATHQPLDDLPGLRTLDMATVASRASLGSES